MDQAFGMKLKAIRQWKGLSLRDVAEINGGAWSGISVAESTGKITPKMLARLARAYDMTVEEIFTCEVKPCECCDGKGWVKK